MAFFRNFGQVAHTLPNGETITINNITKWATIGRKYRDDPRLHIAYIVKDGETPEILSDRLYGDVRFWWSVLVLNNIADLYSQWPRNEEELMDHIERKYWGQSPDDTHHYVNPYGDVIDPYAIKMMTLAPDVEDIIRDQKLTPVTIYEYEFSLNEAKRPILLVDPDYVNLLERELTEVFENGR